MWFIWGKLLLSLLLFLLCLCVFFFLETFFFFLCKAKCCSKQGKENRNRACPINFIIFHHKRTTKKCSLTIQTLTHQLNQIYFLNIIFIIVGNFFSSRFLVLYYCCCCYYRNSFFFCYVFHNTN